MCFPPFCLHITSNFLFICFLLPAVILFQVSLLSHCLAILLVTSQVITLLTTDQAGPCPCQLWSPLFLPQSQAMCFVSSQQNIKKSPFLTFQSLTPMWFSPISLRTALAITLCVINPPLGLYCFLPHYPLIYALEHKFPSLQSLLTNSLSPFLFSCLAQWPYAQFKHIACFRVISG